MQIYQPFIKVIRHSTFLWRGGGREGVHDTLAVLSFALVNYDKAKTGESERRGSQIPNGHGRFCLCETITDLDHHV